MTLAGGHRDRTLRSPGLRLGAIVVLVAASLPGITSLRAVQGQARDPASGRLLYREDHLIRGDDAAPAERLVLYRCPDGTAFARKHVDYAASQIAPAFSLVDARDGYREGLDRVGARTDVWSGAKRAVLAAGDGALVADAGFDEFLRRRWDALRAQGELPIRFVVPSFGRSMAFHVERRDASRIDGVPVQNFRLRLDGPLGLFTPNIDVAYDSIQRTLRRFDGISNIRSDAGKALRARIDFPLPPTAAADAQWQAALAAPLTRCALGG
jgi:hypothetical protein